MADSKKLELSCISCKRLKRKCSRERPRCILCRRTDRNCEYPDAQPSNDAVVVAELRTRIRELENELSKHRENAEDVQILPSSRVSSILTLDRATALPTAATQDVRNQEDFAQLFLDSVACRNNEMRLWNTIQTALADRPISPFTSSELQQLAQHYVRTTHTWFPISMSYQALVSNMSTHGSSFSYTT